MSLINIGGDARDAAYRYKMPPLQTKIEGRGNGIKTVLVNMADVAKHLHIHPAYPTKYFGIELGAQSKFDANIDRAVVNGAHSATDLAKLMEKFIAAFILCPTCKLPELKYKIGSRDIKITCAACGHASVVNTQHKLAGYILKNPPSSFSDKDKDDKDKKKPKKETSENEVVNLNLNAAPSANLERSSGEKLAETVAIATGGAPDDEDDDASSSSSSSSSSDGFFFLSRSHS